MNLQFIDTHSHLTMLEHGPVEEILARAAAAGVGRCITVSTEEENWEPNRLLAEKYPNVYFSLGLHPHEAATWGEREVTLRGYFENGRMPTRCVGIGEFGLDFHYNHSPREAQLTALEAQLHLAKTVGLPAIIHCRDAFEDLFERIEHVGTATRPGVMHCFTGTTEEAKRSLDHGFMISFSGILTFKKASALRETAAQVPLDRVLIETDCPFLSPEPFRGKPNEPSLLPQTAKVLAETLKVSLETLAEKTTENAARLFRLTESEKKAS